MKIGFIGLGKMGMGLAQGLSHLKTVQLFGYDISKEACLKFESIPMGRILPIAELIETCEFIFLSIKPQQIQQLKGLFSVKHNHKIFISILAGIPIQMLIPIVQSERVVRVMPNLSAICGAAVSGYSFAEGFNEADKTIVRELLSATGNSYEVDEGHLDVVTGLSGSGIAYVMSFIQGMADGAVRGGLSREMALQMSCDTVVGALKLLEETKSHPMEIRDLICSPAGTTIEAVAHLERKGFSGLVADAVYIATERSKAMGNNKLNIKG